MKTRDELEIEAHQERTAILKSIEKEGLLPKGKLAPLASATPEPKICVNQINPDFIKTEKTLNRVLEKALDDDAFGAYAIAVERNFNVKVKPTKVSKLFEKRLEHNIMLILEGENLFQTDYQTDYQTDLTINEIQSNNRHKFKKIFAPKQLYSEVKTFFRNLEVSPVAFTQINYIPEEVFVGNRVKLAKEEVNLNVALADRLVPTTYQVKAPDYKTALKDYIETKQANHDGTSFAVHLVRLPNSYDKKLLQRAAIEKLHASNPNTLFGKTAQDIPVSVTLAPVLAEAIDENKVKQSQSFRNHLWSRRTQDTAKQEAHHPSEYQGQSHHPAILSPRRK